MTEHSTDRAHEDAIDRALGVRSRRRILGWLQLTRFATMVLGMLAAFVFIAIGFGADVTWAKIAAGISAVLFVAAYAAPSIEVRDTATTVAPSGPQWSAVPDPPLGRDAILAARPWLKTADNAGSATVSAKYDDGDGHVAFLRMSYASTATIPIPNQLDHRALYVWARLPASLPGLTVRRQLQNAVQRDGDIVIESDHFNRTVRVQIDSRTLPRDEWSRYATAVLTPRAVESLDGMPQEAVVIQIAQQFVLCEVGTDPDQIAAVAPAIAQFAASIERHVIATYSEYADPAIS